MTEVLKSWTFEETCPHCENVAPMEVKSELRQHHELHDPRSGVTWTEGYRYQVLVCPACEGVTLRRFYDHELRDPEELRLEVLYPTDSEIPSGLPEGIAREYRAAVKVRSVSANAYGVLVGRLLELVCEDRGATSGSLEARLKQLSEKGEIPEKLVEMAEGLQQLRHVGAHATLGELTDAEVPILERLARAILEYVYSAPQLVQETSARLEELRVLQRRKKGRKKQK